MEENSPVDCFRRRGNERSEAIGAAAPRQNPLLSAKESTTIDTMVSMVVLLFLISSFHLTLDHSSALIYNESDSGCERREAYAAEKQNQTISCCFIRYSFSVGRYLKNGYSA